MPADILRDVPEAPATPPPSSFDDLGAQIQQTYGNLQASREKQAQGLEARAAAVNPKLEAAQTAGADFRAEMEARRGEIEASRPVITRPPSRQLHEFLAPTEGEPPENTVMKLMQGLGLFATGLGGLAKGDARAGLASFKGALEGWREGDAARADRHFKDWQASTQAALDNWDLERQSYLDFFEQKNKSLDSMLKDAELEAVKQGNTMAADAFRSGSLEVGLKYLQDWRNHQDQTAIAMAHVVQAKTNHEDMVRLREEQIAANIDARKTREAERLRHEEERLEQPAHDKAYDYERGEIRQVSKREEAENVQATKSGKPALRSIKPQQEQLLERLSVAPRILDRLDALVDKVNAAEPGANITQGLINRLKRRTGISADIQELMTLNLDNALENAAALSGGQPRIAILQMLRGEATPDLSMTADVAHRLIDTTRTTIYNRGQAITGDPDTIIKMAKQYRNYSPKDKVAPSAATDTDPLGIRR